MSTIKPKQGMKLKEQYYKLALLYIEAFEAKQGYEFTDWITDEDLGIAVFIDQYYINFDDLRHDIDNDVPKGLIFQYFDDGLEWYEKHGVDACIKKINYRSYVMGARFEMI